MSDLNLTLTEEDIILLQNAYDSKNKSRFGVIGCFESQDSMWLETTSEHKSNLRFVITGNLSAYQTEESLIPFLNRYYPKLNRLYPNSELTIAGRDPSPAIKKACEVFPKIKLIANPANMGSVLKNADVYICPTDIGGGLKLRIMDGLKAGLPVITHKISARGYSRFIDAGCLMAYENETSFEAHLSTIKSKIQQFRKSDIRKLYNEHFSFNSGKNRLKMILEENSLIK